MAEKKKESLEELDIKKVKLGTSLALAGKDTVAMALIALGMDFINKGEYVVGGALITAGWILLLIQQVI